MLLYMIADYLSRSTPGVTTGGFTLDCTYTYSEGPAQDFCGDKGNVHFDFFHSLFEKIVIHGSGESLLTQQGQ